MLRPNKIVIYDELGADEVATWQWLLHSPVEMHVAGNKVTTDYTYEGRGSFTSVARFTVSRLRTLLQPMSGSPVVSLRPRSRKVSQAMASHR